jgi:hypothetical protein
VEFCGPVHSERSPMYLSSKRSAYFCQSYVLISEENVQLLYIFNLGMGGNSFDNNRKYGMK